MCDIWGSVLGYLFDVCFVVWDWEVVCDSLGYSRDCW